MLATQSRLTRTAAPACRSSRPVVAALSHKPHSQPQQSKAARCTYFVGTPVHKALRVAAVLALCSLPAHAALAADGFAIGGLEGASGGDDTYVYTTRDVAVDLASPLLAYKVASLLFNQEVPVWLDVIIGSAALAALYVVLSGDTSLDAYLQ